MIKLVQTVREGKKRREGEMLLSSFRGKGGEGETFVNIGSRKFPEGSGHSLSRGKRGEKGGMRKIYNREKRGERAQSELG